MIMEAWARSSSCDRLIEVKNEKYHGLPQKSLLQDLKAWGNSEQTVSVGYWQMGDEVSSWTARIDGFYK